MNVREVLSWRARAAVGLPGKHYARRRRLDRQHRISLALFAGRSHPALASRIADGLGIELGDVDLGTFKSGEAYCRYGESVRGADVFIVQACLRPVNDHLVELLLMLEAARLASAHRVTAVMPWYPYARQDRKAAPREPVSARLVADLLEVAGAERAITVDLHAGQIQGFFSVPVDHVTALPLFAQHLAARGLRGNGVVAVAPDVGRLKLVRRLSRLLDCDVAVVSKTRPRPDQVEVGELIGHVHDRTAIIGDDMIVTGSTLLAAVRAVRGAGASDVVAFATHAAFAGDALERLLASDLSELIVTDTVPIDPAEAEGRLTVLSIAPLLAQTIEHVFSGKSVSALFGGQEVF